MSLSFLDQNQLGTCSQEEALLNYSSGLAPGKLHFYKVSTWFLWSLKLNTTAWFLIWATFGFTWGSFKKKKNKNQKTHNVQVLTPDR